MSAIDPPHSSSKEFAPPNGPESPFVHAHLLDRQGGGRRMDDDEVANWQPEQGLLWVHLEVGNALGMNWIIEHSGVDALIAEAMAAGETRPRSVALPSGLLVILRGVNMNPGSEPEDMVSIRIWIERNRIITVRRRFLLSIQDLRQDIAQNIGPKTTGEFLISLTERLALRIGNVVEDVDVQVERIEEQLSESDIGSLQRRVGAMRREAAAIRRYLAPQREALNRIRGKTELLNAQELHDLEEQSDLMTRFIEDLDLAREQAVLLHEQLASRLANEQNARLYVLSIVAALFLPLSFLTGLLGMNVAGLPGLEYLPAFAISVGIMLGVAVALLVYFRFKRWI
jgi:zinc transporter